MVAESGRRAGNCGPQARKGAAGRPPGGGGWAPRGIWGRQMPQGSSASAALGPEATRVTKPCKFIGFGAVDDNTPYWDEPGTCQVDNYMGHLQRGLPETHPTCKCPSGPASPRGPRWKLGNLAGRHRPPATWHNYPTWAYWTWRSTWALARRMPLGCALQAAPHSSQASLLARAPSELSTWQVPGSSQ